MSRPIRWCLLAQKPCLKRTGTPRLILRQDEKSGLPLLFCKRLIGFQYQLMERYEDAERHYKKALDIRERAPWPDYSHIADSLNNVAQVYKRQWRTAEAIPLLERSLAMREKGLGREHPQIAQSLQNLASAMELQGHISESEPLLWRALEIRLKAQGADNPETAGAMGKLAENLHKQGKFKDADPHFRRALARIMHQTHA